MTIPLTVKYFQGTSEDFDSLTQQLNEWLVAGKFAKYQLNSTPHWNEKLQHWELLVTVMYHTEAVANPIVKPVMAMMPQRID